MGNDQFIFDLSDDADETTDFVVGTDTDDVLAPTGFGTAFGKIAVVQAAASDDANGNAAIVFGARMQSRARASQLEILHEGDFVIVSVEVVGAPGFEPGTSTMSR